MKKIMLVVATIILSAFLIGEVIGRYYGLTTMPVFIEDPDFEYISAANQNVHIYRNHFETNQFSQRSKTLQKSDTIVYLLLGDSVIFGGNSIDQDSITSSRLEEMIERKTGKRIRVLNISSKSWGPDNIAAYIKKYGTFGASKIILTASSHDSHDNMTFKPIVGREDSHPDKNPTLAWSRILEKGLPILRAKLGSKPIRIDTSGLTQTPGFNTGFRSLSQLADSLKIPFAIYLHKTTQEIKKGSWEDGGKEIQAFCKQNNVKIIELNEDLTMYDDYIHFNNKGHKFLSDKFYELLVSK